MIIGQLVSTFSKFYREEDEKKVTFRSTPAGIMVIALILLNRFIPGKIILVQYCMCRQSYVLILYKYLLCKSEKYFQAAR